MKKPRKTLTAEMTPLPVASSSSRSAPAAGRGGTWKTGAGYSSHPRAAFYHIPLYLHSQHARQHPSQRPRCRRGLPRLPHRELVALHGTHLPHTFRKKTEQPIELRMPRASQIELLGYSGQFDYPEFLAEVRLFSPPAPHAHSEVPLRLCTAPRAHFDVPLRLCTS